MSDQQLPESTPVEQPQPAIIDSRFRFVALPIPTDSLREYFTDKSLIFVADYSTSKAPFKGDMFLTYLTNLNVPCDVQFSAGLPYETYEEIMLAYMKQVGVMTAPCLRVMAAELMLCAKGMPHELSPYHTLATADVIAQFIEKNKEVVQSWLDFIDSTQVFALSSIKVLNAHFAPKERFPIIDDREVVGRNAAQLFTVTMFIAVYFSLEKASYKQSYYVQQFEEYHFKNNHLSMYFGHESNLASMLFSAFAAGSFKAEDLGACRLFNIGVFDKESPYYKAETYVAAPEHQFPEDTDAVQV